MSTRKANKILRSLSNGHSFEKSIKITDSFSLFNNEAQSFIVYYTDSIKYCVVEDDFAYFYGTYNKEKFFDCTFYREDIMDSTSLNNDYNSREQKLKFVSRFMKSPENFKYFNDILKHLSYQSGIIDKVRYRYDVSKNNHIIDYTIDVGSPWIMLSFVFNENLSNAVVINMNYKTNSSKFSLYDGRDFTESLLMAFQKEGSIKLFADPDFDQNVFMNIKEAIILDQIIEY